MTRLDPLRVPAAHGIQAWVFSLLLHVFMVTAAVQFVSELPPPPLDEPFRLEVTMVTDPHAPADVEPRESPTTRQSQPTQTPPVRTETRRKPVVRELQTTPEATVLQQDTRPPVDTAPPEPQAVEAESQPIVSQESQAVQPVIQEVMTEPAAHDAPTVHETTPAAQPEVATVQASPMATEPAAPNESATAMTVPAQVTQPLVEAKQTEPVVRESALAETRPVRPVPVTRADYGWLAESLGRRIVVKRYPHRARLNHWEGKVLLTAVIREDGHLGDLRVQESSGYDVLDEDAMELVKQACPLELMRPLGRPEVVVQIPISYTLR